MSELLDKAILIAQQSKQAAFHILQRNDTGETGGHQSGFHMQYDVASEMFFDRPGIKGEKLEKDIRISWQGGAIETSGRLHYYGEKTRNEYRVTRFGRGFSLLGPENTGSLLVFAKKSDDFYEAVILDDEQDVEDFYDCFNIPTTCGGCLLSTLGFQQQDIFGIDVKISNFLANIQDFPDTDVMSKFAQECWDFNDMKIKQNPDGTLEQWLDTEYQVYRAVEEKQFSERIKQPFANMDEFLGFSLSILNRRKSRAGKSLEHHLSTIFTSANLKFEEQVITEDKKKPDFIFPGGKEYHDEYFPVEKLVLLGAKTTLKDRWRQVISEADRIQHKHLFTLQGKISTNQLKEMKDADIHLVLPNSKLGSIPSSFVNDVIDLKQFISFVRAKQL